MVSRKNLGKTAGWITQPQTMLGNWVGQQIGTGTKSGIERVQNKGQNFSVNNYKSNLNLPTYNSRYPGFDEADYKKLEQGAINRGLTGEQKTQFMDEAYQYYYPQVLNKHGLDKRAEEINKFASENGQSILNGDKNVSRNLKLVDLAQTAKRVKGFAYDYPDEQIIEAMKTEIPDGEQLILNYLNNGDDTILYKAGLKKTDAQIQLDNYNKNKESINKALIGNWKELSDDGIKYLNNYTTLYNIVDEARQEGMGQGMTDNDLLLNLAYLSPEIQQIVNETENLTLDNEDKAIFGMLDPTTSVRQGWNDTKNNIRDFLGWNSETPATLNDIAEEMYVRENRGGQAMKNAKANWRTFGDTLAKFGYRVPRDIENFGLEYELKSNNNLSQEDIDRIRTKIGINKQEVQSFNEATGKDQQSYENQIGLDPIIKNYYDRQGLFESLLNEKGFGYKSIGEATANIDMLAGIGGSIINPALGLAIMGTDTFARENQDAFETLMNAQTKQGVSYEDAYNNAVNGAIVVGGLNTVIELGLEKFLGGVETSTAKNIKEFATRDLNKEVSEMMAKRGILDMLGKGLETQARSSLEEGMEEVFQQLVSNIAESGYDPDKQISEGLWRAFESGALNPMNLLAGGSELLNGGSLSEADKQTLIEWVSSLNNGVNQIQGTYNPKSIVENIKNGTSNVGRSLNPSTNKTITRTIPEKVVEGGMKLTPTERARVEATGITPANFILSEGIAGLDSQDKIAQLANIGAEGYNNVTKIFKEVIPDTEVIESKEAQKMLNIMAKVIESSDILSEEYADYLQTIKNLAQQTEFDPYTALAIKRDFDALAGHDLYNSKGQVMKDIEKETIAGWRADLNEKLNKLGEKYGVDVKKENQRVMNAITIRDGLLRAMSQNKKNNFLGLGDLGFGALLSSGNPVQAVAMIGLKKFAQNNIGNMAQKLYNLNNTPLTPLEKKGASFIKKGDNNAGNLSLSSIMNNPTTVDNTQQAVDAGDLGNAPLDTIPDRNVGANPTDTVISENVNEMAGNQAQELYNQGDNNLSSNSEQMTEVKSYTAEELGLPPVSATMLKNLDRSKYIPVEDPQTKKVVFYKVEELEKSFQPVEETKMETYESYTSKDLANLQRSFREMFPSKASEFDAMLINGEISDGNSLVRALNKVVGIERTELFLDSINRAKNSIYNESVEEKQSPIGGERYTDYNADTEGVGNIPIEEPYDTDEGFNGADEGWQDPNLDDEELERYADEAYKPEIVMTEEEINKWEEKDTKKEATEWAEKMWKKVGWIKDKDGGWFRYAQHYIGEYDVKNGYYNKNPKAMKKTMELERATEKQHKDWVKEHAKMKIDFDKADSKNNNKTKQYADNSYKPSITMTEKSINKKQAKEKINNIIDRVWHDIGDEGDWDWYKKMKKKDVLVYVKDQVLDDMHENGVKSADFGLEYSDVEKLIKKFVNDKFSNEKKIQEAIKNPKPLTMSDDELMAFSRSMRYKK